jgi:hypothetical protein
MEHLEKLSGETPTPWSSPARRAARSGHELPPGSLLPALKVARLRRSHPCAPPFGRDIHDASGRVLEGAVEDPRASVRRIHTFRLRARVEQDLDAIVELEEILSPRTIDDDGHAR